MNRLALVVVLLVACSESEPEEGDEGQDNVICFGAFYECRDFNACNPDGICIEFNQMVPTYCGDCRDPGGTCECVDDDYCAEFERWNPFDPSSDTPSEAGLSCEQLVPPGE